MKLQEIVDKTFERSKSINPLEWMPALRMANDGAKEDVLNTNGCFNYVWSSALMDVVKPKQVVELGGAMGVWSICVLQNLPPESQLYSITLEEHGLEFSYVQDTYYNFHPIVGDDLDLNNFKGVDLHKTDIWYFDSLHTYEQLTKELDLYSPFFKKGAILLFDDIRMAELWPVWEKLAYEKIELTDPCHFTGWGVAIVKDEINWNMGEVTFA